MCGGVSRTFGSTDDEGEAGVDVHTHDRLNVTSQHSFRSHHRTSCAVCVVSVCVSVSVSD